MRSRIAIILGAALLLIARVGMAEYQEGLHYEPIEPTPPLNSGDKVEVLEFFMYGCPHCDQFDPVVKKWLAGQPEHVEFRHVPAMFGGSANLHGEAFYTLQMMGEGERLHPLLFAEIHQKKNRLKDADALEAFLRDNGVDMEKYAEVKRSFAVATKVNQAAALMRRYQVKGVPAIVIDGRYKSGKGFSSYKDILDMADYVVKKIIEERKSAGTL